MMSDEDISEEALSRLARQYTALEALPFLATDRTDTALTRAFADSCNVDDPIDLIRQFSSCVDDGVIPPPYILIAIATKFREYLGANGESPMDFFFFGDRKQGKKDLLVQRMKDESRNRVYAFMWDVLEKSKKEGKPKKALAAAIEALERFPEIDMKPESLAREYGRSGTASILDAAQAVVKEMGF
jgi:hypothetical protein